jgi:predicted MFS family arabinose efflux permease
LFASLRARLPDRNLWVVYRTMIVLSTAYGIALAVMPMVLEHRDLGADVVGELASFFALGLVLFAAPSGAVIRRVSARWTLAISIVGYGVMIGIIPLLASYRALAIDRFVDGLFSMGAWMSGETLVLWRAPKESKGLATSLSASFTMSGYPIGAAVSFGLSSWLSPEHRFVLAGAIACLAAVVCATGLDPDPAVTHEPVVESAPAAGTGVLDLVWRIKTSCAATFATGFFQSSGALFIPRFLVDDRHVPEEQASLVVGLVGLGMLLFASPAGRLGDRIGHLRVMRVLAILGIAGMLAFLVLDSFPIMCVVLVIAGGAITSMPPLSLALQGVIARPDEYTRTNSVFNVFFASGLVIGPFLTGRVFHAFGGEAMLWLFAALWVVFVALSVVFRRDDPRLSDPARAA